MKIRRLLILLFLTQFSTSPVLALLDNDIVVSIKPLHSIVANITKNVATPVLLLSSPASPHTYTLRPSNASVIANAKVIIWMGPQIETFLQKPIATLNRNAQIIEFPQPNAENDPHIWLNPLLVKNMAKKIAATLTLSDPSNANLYQENLQSTLARLDALDKRLSRTLANTKPIFVLHNAYSHLAERYNLNIAGVIFKNPEVKPGAKRIRQIRQALKTSNVSCVFAEPEFDDKIITSLFSGTQIKTGILDPLGTDTKAGPDHYFQMMQKLADTIQNCN